MLLVAPVKKERCIPMTEDQKGLWGIDQLNLPRSDLPAITHIDYSARVQTVTRDTNPAYYDLLKEFDAQTGCPVLINTSFNVRGEPIVCTPEDAYRCFMRTNMDYLVLGPYVVSKEEQERSRRGYEEFVKTMDRQTQPASSTPTKHFGLGGEEFFITKIKEGLSFSSDSLTQEEENFLGTKVGDLLGNPNFTPEFGQRLQAKCIGALSEIYARDTAGNRQAAVMWRENNEHIYNHSELSLSGIVQNWYLSVGRAQEKKASGCSSMFVWLLIPMLFVVVGSVLNGCQNQLSEERKEMTNQEEQKTALEVLESRAAWMGLPRPFLETLAQKLNSGIASWCVPEG